MQTISPALAARIYTILNATLGVSNDVWHRWEFCQAVRGGAPEYPLDIAGMKFITNPPQVVCDDSMNTAVARANTQIKQACAREGQKIPIRVLSDTSTDALGRFVASLGLEPELADAKAYLSNMRAVIPVANSGPVAAVEHPIDLGVLIAAIDAAQPRVGDQE